MAASAFASAFFALVLAIFTWRLIVVGRDQHKAAMDAIDVAKVNAGIASLNAQAAQTSADAASRTVAIMEDTARKQLRAYVNVSSALVRYDPRKPDGCNIEVRVKNYGQTPALQVISRWGEHVREWPLQSKLPEIPPIPIGVGPLPPGRESIQRVPIGDLSSWEEEELKAGRAGVYFWGVVTYRDIYGDPHVTNIKLVCEGEGLRAGHMHECGEDGNEAT